MKFIEDLEREHDSSVYRLTKILNDDNCCEQLFIAANHTKRKFVCQEVHLKALIEISNICQNNCFYCGLRKDNIFIKRYKMQPSEIINLAKNAAQSGYKTIVLQSGESNAINSDQLCSIIREIKKFNVQITLSLGEKSFDEYKAYRQAGADRYLLRIETTNKELYAKFHPKMSLAYRKKCLRNLQLLGYETGSGLLVGLPGSSAEILARDLMFLKKNDFDMVGIGPFIPAPKTPLCDANKGNMKLALKMIALTRLLLPNINIPATTAIETINQNCGRKMALQSGANVIMPSITDVKYHELYMLYPGKYRMQADVQQTYKNFDNMITQMGDKISSSNGNSKRYNQRQLV